MIRKLQKRLLLASMLSLFLVLCILIGTAAVRAHRGEIMAETADEESLRITVKLPSERAKK